MWTPCIADKNFAQILDRKVERYSYFAVFFILREANGDTWKRSRRDRIYFRSRRCWSWEKQLYAGWFQGKIKVSTHPCSKIELRKLKTFGESQWEPIIRVNQYLNIFALRPGFFRCLSWFWEWERKFEYILPSFEFGCEPGNRTVKLPAFKSKLKVYCQVSNVTTLIFTYDFKFITHNLTD